MRDLAIASRWWSFTTPTSVAFYKQGAEIAHQLWNNNTAFVFLVYQHSSPKVDSVDLATLWDVVRATRRDGGQLNEYLDRASLVVHDGETLGESFKLARTGPPDLWCHALN